MGDKKKNKEKLPTPTTTIEADPDMLLKLFRNRRVQVGLVMFVLPEVESVDDDDQLEVLEKACSFFEDYVGDVDENLNGIDDDPDDNPDADDDEEEDDDDDEDE